MPFDFEPPGAATQAQACEDIALLPDEFCLHISRDIPAASKKRPKNLAARRRVCGFTSGINAQLRPAAAPGRSRARWPAPTRTREKPSMNTLHTRIRLVSVSLVLLACGLDAVAPTQAGIVISTPTGLSPGDHFRIVFLTDGTTYATSTSIGDYNTFVRNDAAKQAGGDVTYNGVTLTWNAIASTADTNVLTNIGETGASVWLANGPEVASSDNATGLWSGNLLHVINQDLTGLGYPPALAWTGSLADGSTSNYPLGIGAATVGNRGVTGSGWVDAYTYASGPYFNWLCGCLIYPQQDGFYGISQTLTVPGSATVPEPSTLVMMLTAAVGGMAGRWSRKRKARSTAPPERKFGGRP